MKILAFDIGNSSTKVGTFEHDILVKRESKPFDHTFAALRSANFETPDYVVIASVTRSHNSLIQYFESLRIPVLELTHTTPLPFVNAYRTPETLGKDRLASAAGAHQLYPGETCLIIDAGTCLKYDMIDAKGVYLGGNIAPGIQMRIDAMQHFTAKLPSVPKEWPSNNIGNDTKTALQNGALQGALLEVQGFIALYKKQFGNIKVLFSGGDASFLHPHLSDESITLQPDIVLYGLNHILKHTLG
jgi:type III pantothenate kinase